ncbi:endolytic transglycosylase MltG [Sinimarinibacterium sp. CAU 1509]|uniref:endolytic transglycosylase MltG n=1 Tax=Sinimarinibacterium sp. CAU 1509 TaxID=2562283 RepID=UPI00200A6CC1|nr:endolytic transglycosylase MltG [Sinimarinibacterium sp. CAU 1509]
MKRLLLIFVVFLGAAALFASDVRRVLDAPMNLGANTTLTITPGQTLSAVLETLQERQWLVSPQRNTLYLRTYARMTGLGTRIKAGEYPLSPGMTALQALQLFESGKTVSYQLRLLEGWTFRQALSAIREHPNIQQTLGDAAEAAILQQLGVEVGSLEGRLFPDTYHFPSGTTDIAVIRRAYDTMTTALQQAWDQRASDLPYASADEALIMASIVEKETGDASERAQIAGVFVRRLQLGMRLQTDPTVIYGLGSAFDGNLRKRDLLADTPYNTYTRNGLPPTPICLPGRAALYAALHPAEGKALFFVARGDGTHAFSDTLDQHEAAVRRYQLKK